MMQADLHIHTTASDGGFTPLEIIRIASKKRLSHIAITDHDTIDGLVSLKGQNTGNINVIPGIELSIDLPDNEVHILGYYINPLNKLLQNQLEFIIDGRRKRVGYILTKLNALGYSITMDDVRRCAGTSTSIGRPNIALSLVEKGYFQTVSDVFEILLHKNGPAYVPHYKLSPCQAIEMIKACGGIPVLAHPGLIGDETIVQKMINYGVLGIEAYHPKHTSTQTNNYVKLALNNNLLITGGSDFHGIPSRYPEELGIFTIPDKLALKLQQYHLELK